MVRGLQNVIHVSSKNVTLPILNNVLIKTREGIVELTSTNLEIAVVSQVRAKIEVGGVFTIPTKTLADYAQLLSDEQVEIELKEDTLLVSTPKSKTKIKGESAEEFPVIPSAEGGTTFRFNTNQLKEALSQAVFSVSRSDVRPELSGVLFHINNPENKGILFLAATDSYRLGERRVAVQNEEKEKEVRVIVPARTAHEMIRALAGVEQETVDITVAEGQISMVVEGVSIVSRLIEGKYPDYQQIIPGNFGVEALVDTANLVQQIRAASLFSTTGVNAVSAAFVPDENSIKLSSANTQLGEFESAVEGEVSGDAHTVMLNHRYVLEGLQHMDTEKVRVKVVNADSPCVFAPEGKSDFLYIVMPIKQ